MSICTTENGSPYISSVDLVIDGDRVNSDGEDNARPGDEMLRMYVGVSDAGRREIKRLLDKADCYLYKGSLSVGTVVKYIDTRILRQEVQDEGVELAVVKDPNFSYGLAWKRKSLNPETSETQRPDRFERQMSQALPSWYKILNLF
ncbi:hypothetical protein J4444_02395 [Candidatus Woesearchaeota archaeon]|nr:hypothetical protein [Candidatus Woesearchaeota archaeon]